MYILCSQKASFDLILDVNFLSCQGIFAYACMLIIHLYDAALLAKGAGSQLMVLFKVTRLITHLFSVLLPT